MFKREKLLHPATAISCIALFVALGGVTYAAATIGTSQIKNSAVTTSKIKSGAVTNSRIAAKAVSTSKLNTGAVISSKLAGNSVTSSAIAAGAVTAGDVAAGTFIGGQGSSTSKHLSIGAGATNSTLVDFPGLGTLRLSCAAGVGTTNLVNTSGTSINVRYWGVNNGAPDSATIASFNPANQGVITAPNTGTGGIQGLTWHAGFTDASQKQHVATAFVSVNNATGTCIVDVQAQYTG